MSKWTPPLSEMKKFTSMSMPDTGLLFWKEAVSEVTQALSPWFLYGEAFANTMFLQFLDLL